jgi:hypothetical protein
METPAASLAIEDGHIVGRAEIEIVAILVPRRWKQMLWARPRVVFRDPNGNVRHAFAGDTIALNYKATIR